MNLAKSKVILKKINTLHDNIVLGEGMSKIEKDLFLDYIKELYEIVLDGKQKKEKKGKKALDAEYKRSHEKVEKKEEVKDVVVNAVIEEVPDLNIPELRTSVPSKTSAAMPNGIHSDGSSKTSDDVTITTIDPEISALFDEELIDKTAYRFSQTPISDITKAMGINERILTVNLLFNKDQQDFNYVATKLNYFNSFEEASNYLRSEVAGKYDWANNAKKSKAIEFIKLIRRKYNS